MVSKVNFPKVKQDFFALAGGLDLVSPAITIDPGCVIDSQNYEPAIGGGYRRVDGYERFDGRTAPTSSSYWVLPVALVGVATVGATITGATSTATAIVLGSFTGYLVLARLTGTFTAGESITIAAVSIGLTAGMQSINGAATPSDHADYLLLAANDRRQFILVVPGSGPIRGVWVYNDIVYAFRDNAGATAGTMWKSSAGGWVQVTFGRELPFVQRAGVATMTIAAPAVVSFAAHGAAAGAPVTFSTTGALPTGIVAGTTYYVLAPAAGTFNVAATVGGAAITTTGVQSGVHTATFAGFGTVAIGNTVTGATSGATAVVVGALLRTGTWTTNPVGTLVFASVTGAFVSGEALTVGGQLMVQTSSADTAITRLPGGRLEFFNHNFTGSLNTKKMYGADGVNLCFEFDGTNYLPIRTGMASDTPTHILAHKNSLFLSFLASVQYSALGNPYAWTVVLGAGEIDCSSSVAGFLPQGGNQAGSTLAIFTAERTFVLYGTSSIDFRLVSSVFDMGYMPYTCQQVSNDAFGMTSRGIQALVTTLNYGDFDYSSVSHNIQPLITRKRGLECASNTLRTKNQYRIYFTDGTALAVGLTGDKVTGMLVLGYSRPVRCIVSATLSTGAEVTYFGSDNGYVYMDNIGTSQDGAALESWCRLPFNNMKSPRVKKRFRRAILESATEGYSKINVAYDLGYASPDVQPSAPSADMAMTGAGGYWDQFTWDQFTWDSPFVNSPSISLDGCEKNISMLFYSNRAQDQAHIISGLTFITSPRLLAR